MDILEPVLGPLFASGQVADIVMAVMALEAAVLAIWHVRTGRGPALFPLATNLLAGAALLVAFRLALTDSPWPPVALALLAAFVFHLLDLRARWPA